MSCHAWATVQSRNAEKCKGPADEEIKHKNNTTPASIPIAEVL